MTQNDDWFERIWRYREDVIYPSLLGPLFEGIYPIPWERLTAANIADPRWNTCGVYKSAPNSKRPTWAYITSGLSNAWFDDSPSADGVSGFGCEFLLEALEDAQWPIQRLHQIMVYQIAICSGRLDEPSPLGDYHRIPAGGPIDWQSGELTSVMLAPPASVPQTIQQESGRARLFTVIGITASEVAFAHQHGGDALVERLIAANEFPAVRPTRPSAV